MRKRKDKQAATRVREPWDRDRSCNRCGETEGDASVRVSQGHRPLTGPGPKTPRGRRPLCLRAPPTPGRTAPTFSPRAWSRLGEVPESPDLPKAPHPELLHGPAMLENLGQGPSPAAAPGRTGRTVLGHM